MINTPKVSVIVPVYNVEKYIKQCVKSLVNQTLKDIEIIFVNDCGSDNSMDVVQKYAKKDKRIKILKHKKNSGLSASRNTGIEFASAPYLMFCDSDDIYNKTMCAEMYNAIKKSGADIAMCGIKMFYETDVSNDVKNADKEYYRIKYKGVQKISNDIINNCDVSSCNKIFKKSIFEKQGLKYPFGLKYEDAFIFYAYMLWVKKIAFVNKYLYNYRRRDNSIMAQTFNNTDTSAIDHLRIAIEVFNYMKMHNKYDENYEQFWKNIFIPFFNFARWHSSEKYQKQIFDIAHDFMKQNVVSSNLEYYTNRTLEMIYNKTLERINNYLFGLFKIKEAIDKKTYCLCFIPIYKVKIFPDYQKFYLFGIQYKIKHNKPQDKTNA